MRLGAAHEFFRVHLLVGDVAGDAHQLFLALQQAQPHALLGVLDVALDGFLLAVHLLQAQVPERRDDGGEEQQHRRQRRQHREAVLAHGRLAAPPAAPPERRERAVGVVQVGGGSWVLHRACKCRRSRGLQSCGVLA